MDNLPIMQVPETIADLFGVPPYQFFVDRSFILFMFFYKMQ